MLIYYCLHGVKAHALPIIFKTVFTGMATVPQLNLQALHSLYNHMASHLNTAPLTVKKLLCFIFHPYIQGPSGFLRKGTRIIQKFSYSMEHIQ
jgi:hypothetical protein